MASRTVSDFFETVFFVFLCTLEMGQKGKDLSFWNDKIED